MTRVRERDLVIPALEATADAGGTLTTSALISALEVRFQPDGQDGEILSGRSDTYFSQKVRNLISHRETSTSMFSKGYATYHPASESISITGTGHTFLAQVPTE